MGHPLGQFFVQWGELVSVSRELMMDVRCEYTATNIDGRQFDGIDLFGGFDSNQNRIALLADTKKLIAACVKDMLPDILERARTQASEREQFFAHLAKNNARWVVDIIDSETKKR